MSHKSHNHCHENRLESLNKVFVFSIILNFAFVLIEAGAGIVGNSLGLLSDAGHNLGDVFSLLLAMLAFKLSRVHSNNRYTYGYKKSTILVSLLNAIILLAAVGAIITESIRKFANPEVVDSSIMIWTAFAGIIVNGVTAWMLMKQHHGDLNVRGAFLHMAADTLVSIGVVVSGIVIKYTGYWFIDPLVGIIISVVILVSTYRLLSESMRLSLDGVPKNIDINKVHDILKNNENVIDVHHIHVWAISTTDIALTAHVVINDLKYMDSVKHKIREELMEIGIDHSTIEFELVGDVCTCNECG